MLPMYEIRKSELTVKRNKYSLDFPEHMHKYLEIIYVFKGIQKIVVSGNEYTLLQGNAMIIFPDVVHSYESGSAEENDILILIAVPKLFGELLPDMRNLSVADPVITNISPELRTAFENILPSQPIKIQLSWACVIVSYIMETLSAQFEYGAPVEDISFKVIKYIEENFTENITRRRAAHHFGVSECYISKIFSEKLKMDFRNYLGLIRAEYAAYLIRSTDRRFEDIAQLSGFGSFRTFDRTFRAIYGMTPREYKNSINRFIRSS